MKKQLFATVIFTMLTVIAFAQSTSKDVVSSMQMNLKAQTIQPSDLKILEGNWIGTLTYLDYTSGKPYTMPANTTFYQSKSNPNIYLRSVGYSTEPHANQNDSMIISKNGRMIDEFTIISFKKAKDGTTEIVSEKEGFDGNDNKPATIRRTFTITANTFVNKKEILFKGTNKWLVRHTYSFTRMH